jgi:hypothetical protein
MTAQLGWGCSSVAAHLPSMHEALGSIPQHKRKNKQLKLREVPQFVPSDLHINLRS